MISRRLLTVVACLSTCTAAFAAGLAEEYSVNAQYRGAVNKGFRQLGTGSASYESLGGSAFRVRAKGEVKHPENDKIYQFDIAQTFRVNGDSVSLTGTEKKQINAAAAPHESRISELIPFAYLVRLMPAPDEGGDPVRTLSYRGQTYALRYRNAEGRTEVDLYKGDSLVGKFFMAGPLVAGRPARVSKFRINIPEEKLMVSFITSNAYALAGGE